MNFVMIEKKKWKESNYLITKTAKIKIITPMPSNATCNTHIGKLIEKAGIVTEQKVTFHTARHTFATMFLTEGVPLESLSKMMGHKNISKNFNSKQTLIAEFVYQK